MAGPSYDQALQVVTDILCDEFEVPRSAVTVHAHVFEDLGLDSVDMLGVVSMLEQRFGIDILDEDIGHMVVVDGAVDVLLSRAGSR